MRIVAVVAATATAATAAAVLVGAAASQTITAAPPTSVTTTAATLRCTVNPGGTATDTWTTYKPSSAAWGSTAVLTSGKTASSATTEVTLEFPVAGLAPSTSYDQRCKARSSAGTLVSATLTFRTADTTPSPTPTPTSTSTPTPTPTPTVAPDVVIAAAGDICDATNLWGTIGCRGTGNQIDQANPDAVLALGDLQYADFTKYSVYAAEWGPFKAKTLPVIGNHDLRSTASRTAWNTYWGAQAHASTDYQWRQDLGAWSVIVVNSNYASPPPGNVTAVRALVAAANADGDNTIMAFHHPRWSSPCSTCHGSQARSRVWYQIAYDNGVDLILTAHDHRYERFAPMSSTGPAPAGVREFMIGSGGGHPDGSDGTPIAGSELVKGGFVGVTMFTLSASSYSWDARQVTNVDGTAVTFDLGTQPVR